MSRDGSTANSDKCFIHGRNDFKVNYFLNEMKELACRRKWMTGINQVSGTSARGRWCPMALSKAASRHLILLKIENCFHTERRTERFVRLLVNKSRTRIAISAGEVGV